MIDLTACRSINAYPQASYPSTFYTTFSITPYWNGGSLPNASQSIGTIKINKAKQYQIISLAILLVHSLWLLGTFISLLSYFPYLIDNPMQK